AIKLGVSKLTDFSLMDFHNTNFSNETFDVVVAIESIAHSSEKIQVLREAHRVLKPKGRLIVADGYFAKSKTNLSSHEQEIARICFEGVRVPSLPEQQEFESFLREAGFCDINWHDKTLAILPTSKAISHYAKIILPISKILGYLGLRSLSVAHTKAFINQYYAWRDGLGVYGIFCARK
ncbi:MAG: methyltransferase domain-containing protein, partial [Patescibacteria group bacterium]